MAKTKSSKRKVVVGFTGGRDRHLSVLDIAILDLLQMKFRFTHGIGGEATGIDTDAREWCISRGIKFTGFPADWKSFGKYAGRKRNGAMEPLIDVLIAFDGNNGTSHMLNLCKDKKKHIINLQTDPFEVE